MAIINHTHRFIFVHIPKNAGTTVSYWLATYSTWRDLELGGTVLGEALAPPFSRRFGLAKHSTAAKIRSVVGPAIWQSYFKFCVVRDPFSRAYSAYRFLQQWREWQNSSVMDEFARFENFATSEFFQSGPGPDGLFRPQSAWLRDEPAAGQPPGADIEIDHVVRFETLQSSLIAVAERLNLPIKTETLPVRNKSAKPDEYAAGYTEPALKAVRHRYRADFARFSYDSAWTPAV